MSEGAISQEIRLPTDVDGLTSAAAKLDAILARVDKLEGATSRHERRSESAHGREKQRHRESEHGWEGVGKSIEHARSRSREFFEFIGAVAAFEVLEKIADKFIEIGQEAVHAAAMAQRMNFAVDAAAGGSEHGEGVRKWLETNAKTSEFSDEQNKGAYLQLKRYGIGDQQAGRFMKGAEDLAAMAAPTEREGVYREALSAFSRVHAKGKLDARSLMRLGISAEALQTLPQLKGVTKEKAYEEAEKRHIGENDLLNLAVRSTGEHELGQRAAEASQLLLTRMTKLKELPEQFYEKLGETDAAKQLSDTIGHVLKALDPDGPDGKKIFRALEETFKAVSGAVREIDFHQVARTITDDVLPAMKLMASMIEPTVKAVEKLVHLFGLLAPAAAGPGAFLGAAALMDKPKQSAMKAAAAAAITGKTESQLSEMGFFGRALQGVKGALHTAGGMATGGKYVPFREEFAAAARDRAGKAVGEGFAEGINESMPAATAAVMSLGESSHEALMSSIDARSPSRKAEKVGGHFGDGFALGIERSAGRIEDAMDSTMSIPERSFGREVVFPKARSTNLNIENINVNVTAEGGATAEELAKGIAAAVRREVFVALDTTADE